MKKNKGFTLIELLVVISIIGVLTALLLSNFVGIRGRAKDTKLKGDLKQLKTALRLYYNDYQQYPDTTTGTTINGCGTGTTACSTTFATTAPNTVYMEDMPEFSEYARTNNGDGFYLGVVLNNASDKDIATSQAKCNHSTPDTFYVCAD